MAEPPGVPLGTGMEPVEDQEAERQRWAKIQAEVAPVIEENDRARRAVDWGWVVGGHG